MKKSLLIFIFMLPINIPAQEAVIKTVKSPHNRVAVLELYTSEGCSSCPPADHFLSSLKHAGISDQQLVAMAFHVTYWDYIGWKDRFAKKQFDQRQRDLAQNNKKKMVYTPQFVLVGNDYRSYRTFSNDINKLVIQEASVELELTAGIQQLEDNSEQLSLTLKSDISKTRGNDIGLYFAVIENNLSSIVKDGENEGEKLHHDYVVRQLSGPHFQSKPDYRVEKKHLITIQDSWKKEDLSIVAFAENLHTGEVLQAVKLQY